MAGNHCWGDFWFPKGYFLRLKPKGTGGVRVRVTVNRVTRPNPPPRRGGRDPADPPQSPTFKKNIRLRSISKFKFAFNSIFSVFGPEKMNILITRRELSGNEKDGKISGSVQKKGLLSSTNFKCNTLSCSVYCIQRFGHLYIYCKKLTTIIQAKRFVCRRQFIAN